MSTGKTKKDTRLQNLNTWFDEFRPLNQGSSSSRSPPLWILFAGYPSEKWIIQIPQKKNHLLAG
ncbi:hypothetical protein AXF42_Ash008795 [Apostasia shenzhenica]|uniref:Uncharacterized protein n=1 Tax=Apostasia shenzhenica TaxID=1088818 RepID=A0A2I0ASH8_9ASPA|nr:hypothetical protein AXF42_Ash008795 [Apostasia shenzhenica]